MTGTPTPVCRDRATRLVHWAFPPLILFLWWTGQHDRMDWHRWARVRGAGPDGVSAGLGRGRRLDRALLRFRAGPKAAIAYGRGLCGKGREGRWWATVRWAAWSVVGPDRPFVPRAAGPFSEVDTTGSNRGPCRVRRLQRRPDRGAPASLAFNALLGLIGLHLVAIAFYALCPAREPGRPDAHRPAPSAGRRRAAEARRDLAGWAASRRSRRGPWPWLLKGSVRREIRNGPGFERRAATRTPPEFQPSSSSGLDLTDLRLRGARKIFPPLEGKLMGSVA